MIPVQYLLKVLHSRFLYFILFNQRFFTRNLFNFKQEITYPDLEQRFVGF